MAKIAGKSGLVVAFEPVWSTYLSLCSNLQFDLVEKAPIITVPAGLADTEKKSTINVPEGKFAMGSMADANAWAEAQLGASVKSYCVSFTTIDIFRSAATNIPPPEFIKIDVEGAELFVLRGAEKLFSDGRRPLMLIELFAPWQKALGYGPWDVLSWLLDRDYRILFACPSGLVYHMPTSSRPFPPEYEAGYNIIAYHPKSHQARIDLVQHVFSSAATKIFPMTPPPQLNRLN
jgi:FkbM family methyltransferase